MPKSEGLDNLSIHKFFQFSENALFSLVDRHLRNAMLGCDFSLGHLGIEQVMD